MPIFDHIGITYSSAFRRSAGVHYVLPRALFALDVSRIFASDLMNWVRESWLQALPLLARCFWHAQHLTTLVYSVAGRPV